MASGNVLGRLVVLLGLDAAEFTSGLTKAEFQAQRFVQGIEGRAKAVRSALAGLAGAFAVQQAIEFGKAVVHDAAALDDLADATGSSVEALSRLHNQAKISGTSFETLQGVMLKLSAGMANADDESSNVGRALAFLGVEATDPAVALNEIALKLNTYADGVGKVALAKDLFGKSGAAFLATLKDIAETQDVTNTVTRQSAAEAEALEKAIRRLSVEGGGLKKVLLESIVPALNDVIARFKAAREAGLGFFGAFNVSTANILSAGVSELGGTFAEQFGERFKAAKDDVEHFTKAVDAAKRNPLPNFFLVQQKDLDDAITKVNAFKAIQRQMALSGKDDFSLSGYGDMRDVLNNRKEKAEYTGAKDDDSRKAALELRLKQIQSFMDSEAQMLKAREALEQAYYERAELSNDDYFERRAQSIRQIGQIEHFGYAEQIKELENFRANTAKNDTERLEATQKIVEAKKKQASAGLAATTADELNWLSAKTAAESYRRTLEAIAADALALTDPAGAADARLRTSQEELRKRLAVSGDTGAIGNLDRSAAAAVAQAKLGEEARKYGLITESLSDAQARLNLLQQNGSIGEIEALNKRSALATEYIVKLKAEADAFELVAKGMDGIAGEEARAKLARMRLEIDTLSTQTTLLADSLNKKIGDAFGDNLLAVLDHTKSLSQGFKDLEKSAIHMINEIIVNEAKSALFGKGGAASGAGSWLAGLLSSFGAGGAGGGFGMNDRGTGSSPSSLGGLGGLFGLFGGGGGAGPVGGFSDWQMSLLDNVPGFGLPGFADGTDFARGGWAMVGERGPELVNLPRGSKVFPHGRGPDNGQGGQSIVQNITVMPGTSRQTAEQASGDLNRGLLRAQRYR